MNNIQKCKRMRFHREAQVISATQRSVRGGGMERKPDNMMDLTKLSRCKE
jgi:hypothetical protein